jgi:hypothetical protein
VLAESLKDMEADAQKLYQLIWRQFVACQMTPAQYDSTTLTVGAGDFRLKARGRILRFDGWTKVMPALRKGDEDRTLPAVNKGDELSLVELTRLSTSPSRLRASVKRRWLKSWKNAVLAVRRPMRRSSRPFRIAATSALKTVVSMRKKWVRSSPTVWKKLPRADELRFHRANGRQPRPGCQPSGGMEKGARQLLQRLYRPA